MARTAQPASRRQRSGTGWVIVGLLVAGALALAVFMSDGLREEFGSPARPNDPGPAPVATQAADGNAALREGGLEARQIGTRAETTQQQQREVAVADTGTTTDTGAPAVSQDQLRAESFLSQAETAYREFRWDDARLEARKVLRMEVDPKTSVRAEDILRGADALEDMFAKLDTKDELRRGWDTHPAMVVVNTRGEDTRVIPVSDLNDKTVPEVEDPVAWLEGRLASEGEIAVLLTSGAGTILKRMDVGGIRPVDLDVIMAEKQAEFQAKVDKVQQGAFARDPLMWYEAAKYAYRNRLDAQVTAMLDKALTFNPFLANAIREDKAQEIYFKMVQMIQKGHKTSAAIWKKQLDDYYAETSVYPQAVAYYEGNLQQVAEARRAALAKKQAEAERIREERRRRAEALQDEAQLKAIEAEPEPVAALVPEPVDEPLTGDAGEAQTAYNEGKAIYDKAINMPVTDERDQLYAKAQTYFDKAMRLYEKLGMTDKMVQANQLRYACIKYRRTF